MQVGLGRRSGVRTLSSGQALGLVFALIASVVTAVIQAPPSLAGQVFTIDTYAGTGTRGFSGDGGAATNATFNAPRNLVADAAGNLYINDRFNHRVRLVSPSGIVTTYAGGGSPPDGVGDDGLATDASLTAGGLAVDASGNLYIADQQNGGVRKVDATTHIITTVFPGTGSTTGVAVDASGAIYVGDVDSESVLKRAADGTVTSLDPGVGRPTDVAVDANENVYVALDTNRVRRIDPLGGEHEFAGNGNGGYTGDGDLAVNATMNLPIALSIDSLGNVYIADNRNNVIRKVDTAGIITTVAGNGVAGYSGDGGTPTDAMLFFPRGVASDGHSGFFIGDSSNQRVRHAARVPDLLGVHMTAAPNNVILGDSLMYAVTVDSNDTVSPTGVKTTQDIGSATLVSATPSQGSCSLVGSTLTCNLGTIPADGRATVAVTVSPTAAGVLTSTVHVQADQADTYPSDDSATVQTQVGAKGCGQKITTDTKLRADLGPCPGNGIVIGADGITLNLGGFKLFGFPGPADGNAVGIVLNGRSNVTVMNGDINNFDAGIAMVNGGHNVIKKVAVHDNIGPDNFDSSFGDGIVMFNSGLNLVDSNVVDHNGIFDNIGQYGAGCEGNVISNNLVTNAVGPSTRGTSSGQGIISNAHTPDLPNTGVVLRNITIAKNVVRDNASAGISNFDVVESLIASNTVTGSGTTNSRGNGIAVQLPFTAQTQIANNRIQGNQVHGNKVDGIQVQGDYNVIQNNDASNNSLRGPGFGFDLHDLNLDQGQDSCLHDVWKNNVWGNGFYSPDCAKGTGGKGPTPSAVAARALAAGSSDVSSDVSSDNPVARRSPRI